MTILAYHAVDPAWSSPLSVHPRLFARHLAWMQRRRSIVPLATALSGRMGPRGVVVTFDDGFASLHEHVFPLLVTSSVPATVFLIAATVADGAAHEVAREPSDIPPTLTVEQIREMREAGVEFASHGFSHRSLTEMTDEECVADLRRSREVLEEVLGREVTAVAYPKGLSNERVWRAARVAGFRFGLAMSRRRRGGGPLEIPRAGVYADNGIGRLAIKASRWYLPVRTGAAYSVARSFVHRDIC